MRSWYGPIFGAAVVLMHGCSCADGNYFKMPEDDSVANVFLSGCSNMSVTCEREGERCTHYEVIGEGACRLQVDFKDGATETLDVQYTRGGCDCIESSVGDNAVVDLAAKRTRPDAGT